MTHFHYIALSYAVTAVVLLALVVHSVRAWRAAARLDDKNKKDGTRI